MTAFSALRAIARMLLEDIYPPQGIGILLNANCSLFYDLMLDLFTTILIRKVEGFNLFRLSPYYFKLTD